MRARYRIKKNVAFSRVNLFLVAKIAWCIKIYISILFTIFFFPLQNTKKKREKLYNYFTIKKKKRTEKEEKKLYSNTNIIVKKEIKTAIALQLRPQRESLVHTSRYITVNEKPFYFHYCKIWKRKKEKKS